MLTPFPEWTERGDKSLGGEKGSQKASPLTHPAHVPPGANELSLHMRTSPHVRETSIRNATVSDERPWTVVGSESTVSTGTREGAGTEAAGEKEH